MVVLSWFLVFIWNCWYMKAEIFGISLQSVSCT